MVKTAREGIKFVKDVITTSKDKNDIAILVMGEYMLENIERHFDSGKGIDEEMQIGGFSRPETPKEVLEGC